MSIEISVVMPCLNEEDNVAAIAEAVSDQLTGAGVTSFEIIFIDNGSTDRTIEILRAICAADPQVRAIINNRNFGQMRSPTYGIYQASGRAVIGMCSDFQDPPALLGELIARWRAGAKIVLGVRRTEKTGALLGWVRRAGYNALAKVGDYKVIPGATGFGLYDRAVVDCLSQWREPEPFFRGMLVESGYALETIPYDRPGRAGGRTKNNWATLLSFALSGLASSSKSLLRIPLLLGLLSALPLGLCLAGAVIQALRGAPATGFLIAALVEFNFALLFLAVGLIGEQVRLLAERSRNTPLVIERERINFPDLSAGAVETRLRRIQASS